jgi:FkbM family methyltransferase
MKAKYDLILFLLFAVVSARFMQRECREKQIHYFAQNQQRFYGEEATDALKERLKRCPHAIRSSSDALVIDVGANAGQSYEFLRQYSPDALAVLFEPNAASVAHLHEKFGTDANVLIIAAAVGEHNGTTVTFNTQIQNRPDNQHGSLATHNVYGNTGEFRTTVPMVSLDAVIGEIMRKYQKRSVHLMKIDTEGFDQLVLYGARAMLPSVRAILWECHELQRKVRGGPGTTIFESVQFLEELGFVTFIVGDKLLRVDSGLYHPHYDTAMQWQNCFSVNHKESVVLDCIDDALLPVCSTVPMQ